FSEFRVQCSDQFAERFAMPGHELREEQRRNGGIPLRQIKARADTAALFAAKQDVLPEHQFADVFEADRHFVEFTTELFRQLVDELGYREGFRDVAWKIAHPCKMPDQQRKYLMWVDEAAVTIDGADAVTVAVGAEAGVVFSRKHGSPERFDVWLDRLRV